MFFWTTSSKLSCYDKREIDSLSNKGSCHTEKNSVRVTFFSSLTSKVQKWSSIRSWKLKAKVRIWRFSNFYRVLKLQRRRLRFYDKSRRSKKWRSLLNKSISKLELPQSSISKTVSNSKTKFKQRSVINQRRYFSFFFFKITNYLRNYFKRYLSLTKQFSSSLEANVFKKSVLNTDQHFISDFSSSKFIWSWFFSSGASLGFDSFFSEKSLKDKKYLSSSS